MAQRLLHPGPLDEDWRSGLFLSGLRRTGKTTFLRNDLIPELEGQGAVVIYVDLWSDTSANPGTLVKQAVRRTLADLQSPASSLLARLQRVDVNFKVCKFEFDLGTLGETGGTTLAEAFTAVVDRARADLVLIVDEVQQAIAREEGHQLLHALKAARDAVNCRPDPPGYFLFIGTGSHRARVAELTAKRNQAFAGAVSHLYPLLGKDYVEHLLQRLQSAGHTRLPSLDTAVNAFNTLGKRPEEFRRALRAMCNTTNLDPDQCLPVIATTLCSAAAETDIRKVEQLGSLAVAIVNRVVCAADGVHQHLFSQEAATAYTREIGREVRIEEIQPVVNALMADNVLMRRGHGLYDLVDPFVEQIWLERHTMDAAQPFLA